jgi:hypothetical protein
MLYAFYIFSSLLWTITGGDDIDSDLSEAIDTGWVLTNAYLVFCTFYITFHRVSLIRYAMWICYARIGDGQSEKHQKYHH